MLLVLLATVLVARSLVLPLRRLRAGALDVATVQLPERVKRLSESPDPAADLEVAPIPVLSSDEIGQVARAFDQVHAEAVRLAGNEAVLRTSFNAMFVNLSRRSQSLIERLARMIDSLEQNEDDPDRLSNLFSMDHLVTRMRRNSENLLLLAGHESPRKWTEPVPLADVTRAATSEIEQYARVVLNVQPGVAVVGPAVSDVVHLLAELIENATIFSPKDSPVQVSAQELTSGGVLIEVTDRGIGVSESRLAEMNWRLDNPPVMDVSVSRHMGLFAVARLAERHRIRIRLRPASPQGLTALVWLPDTVIERSARAFSGTGSWQPPAAESGGFLQSRRASGVHSIAGTATSQRSSGRHGMVRAEDSTAMQGSVTVPEQTSTATSNWFRSRHTVLGAQSRMPVNGGGNGNGADYTTATVPTTGQRQRRRLWQRRIRRRHVVRRSRAAVRSAGVRTPARAGGHPTPRAGARPTREAGAPAAGVPRTSSRTRSRATRRRQACRCASRRRTSFQDQRPAPATAAARPVPARPAAAPACPAGEEETATRRTRWRLRCRSGHLTWLAAG